MRRLIFGKRYDTDTGKKLIEWNNSKGITDPDYLSENLYKQNTSNGAFFLHGVGGAMTWCARITDDGYTGGEGIRPLSEIEAKNWVKERFSPIEYVQIFEIKEKSRKIVSLSLTHECYEKAKAMSDAKGKSLSAWIESIIMSV